LLSPAHTLLCCGAAVLVWEEINGSLKREYGKIYIDRYNDC
jgi:hypothetical protein